MKLEWYLWIALVVAALFLVLDCRAFWRNSLRAEFSISVLVGLTIELGVIVWIVLRAVQ